MAGDAGTKKGNIYQKLQASGILTVEVNGAGSPHLAVQGKEKGEKLLQRIYQKHKEPGLRDFIDWATNDDGNPIIRYRRNELPESFFNEIQGVYNVLKLQQK